MCCINKQIYCRAGSLKTPIPGRGHAGTETEKLIMPVLNFKNESDAHSFMLECAEFNNQGFKRVLFNWASKEEDVEYKTVNAVWFRCPDDKEDENGETLEHYLIRYVLEIKNLL